MLSIKMYNTQNRFALLFLLITMLYMVSACNESAIVQEEFDTTNSEIINSISYASVKVHGNMKISDALNRARAQGLRVQYMKGIVGVNGEEYTQYIRVEPEWTAKETIEKWTEFHRNSFIDGAEETLQEIEQILSGDLNPRDREIYESHAKKVVINRDLAQSMFASKFSEQMNIVEIQLSGKGGDIDLLIGHPDFEEMSTIADDRFYENVPLQAFRGKAVPIQELRGNRTWMPVGGNIHTWDDGFFRHIDHTLIKFTDYICDGFFLCNPFELLPVISHNATYEHEFILNASKKSGFGGTYFDVSDGLFGQPVSIAFCTSNFPGFYIDTRFLDENNIFEIATGKSQVAFSGGTYSASSIPIATLFEIKFTVTKGDADFGNAVVAGQLGQTAYEGCDNAWCVFAIANVSRAKILGLNANDPFELCVPGQVTWSRDDFTKPNSFFT